jgi:chromosome segregation ATPase
MTTVNDILALAETYAECETYDTTKSPEQARAALRAAVEALVIGHESSRTSMLEMLAKHKAMAQELEAAKDKIKRLIVSYNMGTQNYRSLEAERDALQEENADLAMLADQYKAERDAARAKLDVLEKQEPVAYRAWFDADNGARWLFSLWPKEERLEVDWQPLFKAAGAAHKEQTDE